MGHPWKADLGFRVLGVGFRASRQRVAPSPFRSVLGASCFLRVLEPPATRLTENLALCCKKMGPKWDSSHSRDCPWLSTQTPQPSTLNPKPQTKTLKPNAARWCRSKWLRLKTAQETAPETAPETAQVPTQVPPPRLLTEQDEAVPGR